MRRWDNVDWTVPLLEDGSWPCTHSDETGQPQPATLLNWRHGIDEWPPASPDNKRFRLACPDCGTWWRIWPHGGVARYYAAPLWGVEPVVPKQPTYRQPVRRDIHAIIAAVQEVLPTCRITQEAAYVPTTHDDGIWYFLLPGVAASVQIESGDGMCPFRVETEEESGPDALTFTSVEEIADLIITYFNHHRS